MKLSDFDLKHYVGVVVLVGCLVGAHFLKDDPMMHELLLAMGGIQGIVNLLMDKPGAAQ